MLRAKLTREHLTRVLEHRLFARFSRPVREAAARLRREIETERASRCTLPRFSKLGQHLKLHLGCGPDVREGWVNIDADLNGDCPASPDFYRYDLRLGVPLPDESCSLVYSSHFFEHLSNAYGLALIRESYRVLETGGEFRAALPNHEQMMGYYLRRDRSCWHLANVAEMCPGVPLDEVTYGDFMDGSFYQGGEHVCFYDVERTMRILRSVGFKSVSEDSYREGLDPADKLRRFASFYVRGER